jgi:isopentenyldiphosphate isomerase
MPDELIDLVSKDGKDLGITKMKSKAHVDGDWHKSSHVWIINRGKILLQRRGSNKDFFPNCFDVSCTGHVASSETYEQTAIRELKEELGLDVKESELKVLGIRNQISVMKSRDLISREVMKIFLLYLKPEHGKPRPEKDEISELHFFDPDELRLLLKEKPEMFVADREYFFDTIGKIVTLNAYK